MAQDDDRHNVRVTKGTKERIEDERQERRHEEYGGFNFGAAFFGWLVASGLGAMLIALISAAGAAIAFSTLDSPADVAESITEAPTIGFVGGVLFLLVTGLAYYAGGYVAGRMSRFDGARQGVGVWVMAVAAALLLTVVGAIFGAKYNLLQQIGLPHIPVDAGDITAGGIITLVLTLGVTLLGAVLGGKAGERYHRKIDRAGL